MRSSSTGSPPIAYSYQVAFIDSPSLSPRRAPRRTYCTPASAPRRRLSAPSNATWYHIESAGTPEKISLKGHDEYSIQFSYLQKVAEAFGYTCIRGPFADFIPFKITEKLRSIMVSQGRSSDDDEIICQFIEDLYKYEYLILGNANQ